MKVFEAFLAAISTIAAVVSIVFAVKSFESEKRLRVSLEAASALSHWSASLNVTGGHCAGMLSQFSPQQFNEYANRASNQLRIDQTPFLERCAVNYKKGQFDPEGDLYLNEGERSYIAKQVLYQLNSYETLALKWSSLDADAKETICGQAKVPPNSPYRNFRKVADGTDWWNYPKLEEFMDQCGD